jgi:hypothetical protein
MKISFPVGPGSSFAKDLRLLAAAPEDDLKFLSKLAAPITS